jgi:hypothetical protein
VQQVNLERPAQSRVPEQSVQQVLRQPLQRVLPQLLQRLRKSRLVFYPVTG